MKKPVFIKCELPPGFEIEQPLQMTQKNSPFTLRIYIKIRRKVSEITKQLKP